MLWELREEKKIPTRKIWEGFLEMVTEISWVRLPGEDREKEPKGEAALAKARRQESAGHYLHCGGPEMLVGLWEMMQER